MNDILNGDILRQIKDAFAEIQEPVQILLFGSKGKCDFCEGTRQLLEEVAAANDKVGLSIYDLETDREMAAAFQVDKAPGVVIAAKNGTEIKDVGIRFSGVPSGHEFSTLIDDIVLVSKRELRLEHEDARVPQEPGSTPASSGVRYTHLSLLPEGRPVGPPYGNGEPEHDPRRRRGGY